MNCHSVVSDPLSELQFKNRESEIDSDFGRILINHARRVNAGDDCACLLGAQCPRIFCTKMIDVAVDGSPRPYPVNFKAMFIW
jgi:hypothetical protein